MGRLHDCRLGGADVLRVARLRAAGRVAVARVAHVARHDEHATAAAAATTAAAAAAAAPAAAAAAAPAVPGPGAVPHALTISVWCHSGLIIYLLLERAADALRVVAKAQELGRVALRLRVAIYRRRRRRGGGRARRCRCAGTRKEA